jgi:methylmalonyl-CoA mutase cobalamin-binding domain/chain
MGEKMSELFSKLADAVVDMDDVVSKQIAHEIVRNNLDILMAIEVGLVGGMARAGVLYDEEEYFISELLSCSEAMETAMAVLKPHIADADIKTKGRIVIGSIFGDTHDIGKNIVALILDGAGFAVLDLGRDVSARKFVDNAVAWNADIIAISTLMTTTMDNMGEIIKLLKKENIRNRFKVIIGGKPVSMSFAKKIGADCYSASAAGALRLCTKIMMES